MFVYGTLMVPQVMQDVCGYIGAGTPAQLAGYDRRLVRDEVYPAILPCPGSAVSGLLYRGVSPTQLRRLDAFEGEYYRRSPVIVK